MLTRVVDGVTTKFVGEYYQVTDSVVTKYYGGTAMRVGGRLSFLLSDHLGSNSLILDTAGNVMGETRYTAWGEERYTSGSVSTDYTYTGQYSNTDDFGLMYYKARWYDPQLGRFAQADIRIPGAADPIAWDRYSYVKNNPILYSDPNGEMPCMFRCPGDQMNELEAKMGENYVGDWDIQQQQQNAQTVEFVLTTTVTVLFDPADYYFTAISCLDGDCSGWVLLGLLPFIPSKLANSLDDVGDVAKRLDDIPVNAVDNIADGATTVSKVNFADPYILNDKFLIHGAELGFRTEEEYLEGARKLIQGGNGIVSFVRKSDGATLFYNKYTQEFAILHKDNTIGSYYWAERGWDYWLDQIKRNK